MTKRILAMLLVLVSLLVCCTALAGSGTEANYTDAQAPVIGEVKLSKTSAKVDVKNAAAETLEYTTDTVTVTAPISDKSGLPQALMVDLYVEGTVGITKSIVYQATNPVSFKYDESTGLFKGEFVFDYKMASGSYKFTVKATDIYGNTAEKASAGAVSFVNVQESTCEWTPVINRTADVTLDLNPFGDYTLIGIPISIFEIYKVKGTEEDHSVPAADLKGTVTDENGNSVMTFTGGYDVRSIICLPRMIPAGKYNLHLEAKLSEGSRWAEIDVAFEVPAEYVVSAPTAENFSLAQNGKLLYGDGVELRIQATVKNIIQITGNNSIQVVFVNTADSSKKYTIEETLQSANYTAATKTYNLNMEHVFSSLDILQGDYKLEGIYYKNRAFATPILIYTPKEPVTFSYRDKIVYTQKLIIEDKTAVTLTSKNPTYQIEYIAIPSEDGKALDFPGVKYTSSNENVVTVDKNGLITAVAPGEANVTIEPVDGGCEAKTIEVTVTEKYITNICTNLSTLVLNLLTNPTATLTYSYEPADASLTKGVWTSSNPAVATVDQNGVVTAVAPGEAFVIVEPEKPNPAGCRISPCKVVVTDQTSALLTLDKPNLELHLGGTATYKLTYTSFPEEVSKPGIKWVSSNPAVATVDQEGLVTAVAEGTAIITALPVDSRTSGANCIVTVTKTKTTKVTLNTHEITLEFDPEADKVVSYPFTYTILPEDAYNLGVEWRSTNTAVATVNQSGVVTAVGFGEARIYATAADGSSVFDSCSVTVVPTAVTGISFAHKTITITLNKSGKSTKKLVANVTPQNAEYKLRWSSSNPKIATVKGGVVTAKRAGVCRITATVKGTQLQATIRVKVVKK